MKERPVLFSGPLVNAILAGRKTQTRRLLLHKGGPVHQHRKGGSWRRLHDGLWYWLREDGEPLGVGVRCPYGQPGDRLWVRETWAPHADEEGVYSKDRPGSAAIYYRADNGMRAPEEAEIRTVAEPFINNWRPSIFMPRWASRLTLEVTEVRVERLQDISEEDARAEGAMFTDYGRRCLHDWSGPGPCPAPAEHHQQRAGWSLVPTASHEECLCTARLAFGNYWDRINGEREGACWEANPWVWVIGFRRVEAAS